MELNWILVGIDGALAAAMAVFWVLVSAMHQERGRALAEATELRQSLGALQLEFLELKERPAEAPENAPGPVPFTPAAPLSADRRAEALDLLRGGMDAATLSTTLQLSQAEASLLEKVQGMLAGGTDHRQ